MNCRFPSLAIAVAASFACNAASVGGDPAAQSVEMFVEPSSTQVVPKSTATFAAAVTGTAAYAVRWSVEESGGGTIDSSGLYTAPSSPGVFHVLASLVSDTTPMSARATVNVATASECATTPVPSSNVVYVCDCGSQSPSTCQAGRDTYPGTKSQPKQTWAAVKSAFTSGSSGVTVALCKGGVFTASGASQGWSNTRCTSSNPCTIRDYQADWGGSAKPLVVGSSAGTPLGFGSAGQPEGNYRVWNIAFRGAQAAVGVFFWGDVNDVDLCNLEISNFILGVQIGGYNSTIPGGTNSVQDRITLRNSYVHDNGNWANTAGDAGDGWLGSCNGCVVDSNLFENNGVGSSGHNSYMFQHQIYLNGPTGIPGPAQNMRVTNNRFWTHGVQCAGARMVVHQSQSGLLIENNLFQTDSDVSDSGAACWAFGIGPGGYACPISYTNTVIRRNRFVGVHGNTTFTFEDQTNALVEDNYIELGRTGDAVRIPTQPASGCYPGNTGTVFRNNTIHILPSAGGSTGIRFTNEGSGHVISNNAIWSEPTSYTCATVLAPTAYNGSNWCGTSSPFPGASSGDFTPGSGSALYGTGNTTYFSPTAMGSATWSMSDSGKSRGSPPDIGAFQH